MKIGDVIEGRVSGIQKFGAFVSFPDGSSGLIHISELSDSFVSDVNAYVRPGQTLTVKVIGISPEGKVALSLKQVKTEANEGNKPEAAQRPAVKQPVRPVTAQAPVQMAARPAESMDFEDRLKKFMKESDSRIADNRLYSDRPRRNRKR